MGNLNNGALERNDSRRVALVTGGSRGIGRACAVGLAEDGFDIAVVYAGSVDAARTLGWSERRIFTRLMMPLGWPSIAAGTVLAYARAMGEFGCTLFFAGNYAGITQTIPIAIYFEWMGGNTSVALFWVVVVIAFSFLVILFINMYTAHSQKYRERGLSRAERKQVKQLGGLTDSLDPVGGDALRIDREALAELMRDDAAPQGGR